MTPASEAYLREMSPEKLRKTIYDSERILVTAQRHAAHSFRARIQVESNAVFGPAARLIAESRGVKLLTTAQVVKGY